MKNVFFFNGYSHSFHVNFFIVLLHGFPAIRLCLSDPIMCTPGDVDLLNTSMYIKGNVYLYLCVYTYLFVKKTSNHCSGKNYNKKTTWCSA